jgi:hypothetical protein
MQSIQLYIKDDSGVYQEIELFKDESVTLNQSIQDVKDISKVFTDYTQTFSIPATRINNKIFKHFYNYFIQGFDAREKKDAKLHLNFEPFKVGKIKLEGATLKDNKPNTYKLTFYGSMVNLKDILGDKTLRTLTYFDNASFTYQASTVKTMLSDASNLTLAGNTWTDSLLFPLITHTDRLYYDSGNETANADGLANIYYSTSGTLQGVLWTQLKPALRVITIFKAIEYQYPSIKFSDDFIDQSNTEFYDLFVWLNSKKGDVAESDENLLVPFRVFNNINYTSKSLQSDNLKDFVEVKSTGSFVISPTGRKKDLYARFNCTTSSSLEYNIVLYKDGELFQEFNNLTGQTDFIINSLEVPPATYTFSASAASAGTFTGEFEILKGETGLFNGEDLKVSFTAETAITTSETFVIKDHLPKMKLIDWLTGFFKMFNLTAFVNKEGTIEVKTLNSFFAGTTEEPIAYYDITKDVDKTKSQIDSVLPYNQIDFGYKGLKTFLANDHLERFGIEWGTLKYKNTEFEGKTFKVELPFEHFKFERLYDQTGGTSTTIMFGWGVDDKKSTLVGEPLLFYPIKVTSVSTGVTNPTDIAFLNGSSKEKIDGDTGYFIPSNSISLSSSKNLNFASEMNEYNLRPFSQTLFETYYKNYITDIFRRERRLTKLSAYLPTAVVIKLKLSDRLVIQDKVYKINKISTNFETNLSNLELVNVFDEREPIRNEASAAANVSVSTLTTDSTLITADTTDQVNSVVITDIRKVPSTIPENRPKPINNEPCTVTAATLGVVAQQTNTSTTVFFSHAITALGKICDVSTIESYGFVFSDTSTNIKTIDNIDTLKATSGIDTREFFPKQKTDGCSPKIISNLDLIKTHTTQITGLTNPATKYWRFFARTNTSTDYATADIISTVYASSTFVSVAYTQTTNMTQYTYGGAQDNDIRTIRIMDKDQNLIDFTGVRGIPSSGASTATGKIVAISKIVPYVVSGLPLPALTARDTGSATFPYLISSVDNRETYYHATDRQIAINAAKAGSIGNTGATLVNALTIAQGTDSINPGRALNYEGITLYRNTYKSVESTLGTVGALPDGFYATQLIPVSTADDSYTKNYTTDFPNRQKPNVKSVQQLNGITTNGQVN